MSLGDYFPDGGEEDLPLDIEKPRSVRFDLDSDSEAVTWYEITEGEHADAYSTKMLDYDEDANEVSVMVAPVETQPDTGDAIATGYGLFRDLNHGRIPREVIGDELYKRKYGGSSGGKSKGGSSSTPKDVLEHVAGEGIYDWAKKAAS